MNIENHLSQLLYRYQCVTVPGFGAFLTEIQSAQINKTANSFYPPTKLVSFSSYIKNNDGLLANHISSIEKISYVDALLKIKEQVTIWETKLVDFGSIYIKNIGDFSLNNEQKLVFSPSNQINFLTESFGLTNFNSLEISRITELIVEKNHLAIVSEQEEVENNQKFNFDLIESELETNESLEIETAVEPQEIEKQHYQVPEISIPTQRNNFSVLKYAAILAVGFGVVGYFANDYYNKKIASDTLIVQTKVQKEVNKKIQEATFLISIPETNLSLNVVNEVKPFHVVAGAFRKEANAEKELKQLIKQGFDAKRMNVNKSGLFPVVFSSYATYAEAQLEMNKIHKTINPDAWILIEETK